MAAEANAVGIGVKVRQLLTGQHIITELVPGSAAANSPLEVGEVIQSVNGTDCSYCSTDHLADLLLGPEGSIVNILTIARGGRPKSINLERGIPYKSTSAIPTPKAETKPSGKTAVKTAVKAAPQKTAPSPAVAKASAAKSLGPAAKGGATAAASPPRATSPNPASPSSPSPMSPNSMTMNPYGMYAGMVPFGYMPMAPMMPQANDAMQAAALASKSPMPGPQTQARPSGGSAPPVFQQGTNQSNPFLTNVGMMQGMGPGMQMQAGQNQSNPTGMGIQMQAGQNQSNPMAMGMQMQAGQNQSNPMGMGYGGYDLGMMGWGINGQGGNAMGVNNMGNGMRPQSPVFNMNGMNGMNGMGGMNMNGMGGMNMNGMGGMNMNGMGGMNMNGGMGGMGGPSGYGMGLKGSYGMY